MSATAPLADCPEGEGSVARVEAAVDGDTFRLADGLTVRLAGIEAPKRLPGQEVPEVAEEAARFLERLIAGNAVTLYGKNDERDRHGRVIAMVRLGDGRLLQTLMLESGLARLHGGLAEACLGPLLAAEKSARKAGKGLWNLPQFAVHKAGDPSLQTQKGLYHLVQGRVASVGRGSRMVFLNFGPDWRRDFTAMVARDLVARAVKGGEASLDGLAGRQVLVRGVIEVNGGPLIRVSDRNAIEVLDDE
jgi:endonuclease YncB( thermonuclease family)